MIRKILILFLAVEFLVSSVAIAEPVPQAGAQSGTGQAAIAGQAGEVKAKVTPEAAVLPGNITVNFKDADVRAVLSYIADVSGVDIVPSPEVTGTVTLKLTNKPWMTALDLIVRNYGFAYERDGDIIRVVSVDSLKMEELSTETFTLSYARAEDVMASVKDMLSQRGKISSDTRTNVIVITDVPSVIYKIKQIINRLDRKTPQIMIESKIIETQLSKDEKMGIDWNLQIRAAGAARPTTFPFDSTATDWGLASKVIPKFFPLGTTGGTTTTIGSGGATETTTPGLYPGRNVLDQDAATRNFPFVTADQFTYGTLDFSQFSAVIEYLKDRADTEVISNPRITTLNNKEAKIFVGSVYNYVTKVQYDSQTKERTYDYKDKEIGIRLLVTPNVNEDGEIVVKLKPEIKDVIGFQDIAADFRLPIFSTREAETEVMIRDGDTIFIGGLIKEDTYKDVKKFPLLGDMMGDWPFIGNMVRWKQDSKKRTELIFFITVHVVRNVRQLTEAINAEHERRKGFDDLALDYSTSDNPDKNYVVVEDPNKKSVSAAGPVSAGQQKGKKKK